MSLHKKSIKQLDALTDKKFKSYRRYILINMDTNNDNHVQYSNELEYYRLIRYKEQEAEIYMNCEKMVKENTHVPDGEDIKLDIAREIIKSAKLTTGHEAIYTFQLSEQKKMIGQFKYIIM